jgi:hypothetical protein
VIYDHFFSAALARLHAERRWSASPGVFPMLPGIPLMVRAGS